MRPPPGAFPPGAPQYGAGGYGGAAPGGMPLPPGAMPAGPGSFRPPAGMPPAPGAAPLSTAGVTAGMAGMAIGGPPQAQGPPGMRPMATPPGMQPGVRPMGAPPPGGIQPQQRPPGIGPPMPMAGPPSHPPGPRAMPGAPRPMGPPGGPVPTAGPSAGPPGAGPPQPMQRPPGMANGMPLGQGPMGMAPPGGLPMPGQQPPMQGQPPPGGFGPPSGPPGMRPPGPPGAAYQQAPPMPGMAPQPGMPPGPGYAPPGAPPGMRPGMPPPPGGAMPPGPGAMQPAPQRQSMPSRIDPSQIPRPVAPPVEAVVFQTRSGQHHMHPPPSSSRFFVRDMGSASPRIMRATLNAVPATNELLTNSGMPLAILLQPLALPDPRDDPVQVVDYGEVGPVRCARCKAYLNAFMRWADGGKTFICNFCQAPNPCPEPYFCYLGPDNRRRDADERPELSKGTYEVVATQEYMVRPPQPVIHVFVLDVGHAAVATGATRAACECIEQVLDSLQGGDNTLVGVLTYDSAVHFYNVQPEKPTQMLVMPDTQDVYSPMSATLLASLSKCKAELSELLHSIPTMFAGAAAPESCGAAAMEAAISLLQPTGGKVHMFMCSMPNAGARALKMRDQPAMLNEKDKQLHLLPQDNTYQTMAAQAADFNVCVDLFLMAQAYMDVATLSGVPQMTGGSVYHYLPFNPALDQDQLLNDLKWNVSRPQGLEAIMRLRCSTGVDVDGYLGSFYRPPGSPTDLYMPAVDCDKAVLARLMLLDKLTPGADVYFQNALLYTTTDGARRIRVSTIALPVSDAMGAIFKGADLDAQVVALTRQVASQLPGNTFAQGRDTVNTRTTNTLLAYRKYCATSSSSAQLILPEALKLLPLYSLAVLKCPALRPDVRSDDRALFLLNACQYSAARTMGVLHPRLLPLHQLLAAPLPPDGGIPQQLVLSSEVLDVGGVYLIENGADMLVHFDRDAPDVLVQDLVGCSTADLLAAQHSLMLLPRDNQASRALMDLLTRLRLDRCAYMRLRISKKGDPYEPLFLTMLLEDRSGAGVSYVEYLVHVHREISNRQR